MRPREAGSATAQQEAVLRKDLGGYPSKDTKVASTWCEYHILFWTLPLPRKILDWVPEVWGFLTLKTQILLLPCVTSASVFSHHRLPRLKSCVGALHDFTLGQAETTVSMCENVQKSSVQMFAGLPQRGPRIHHTPEVVVRWYKRGVLPALCSNHLINLILII